MQSFHLLAFRGEGEERLDWAQRLLGDLTRGLGMIDIQADVLQSVVSDPRPVKSVQVLECGRAEQHAEHRYGSRLP